jgi:2-polyprenyl-3-methyl-5-hydroxy-6-metoxy-1,4-benzoquinol methylase
LSTAQVRSYGWSSSHAPASTGYIAPAVLGRLAALRARRVIDLGCGNGSLTAEVARAGFSVVGVDADAEGVEIAASANPGIAFHRVGVHEDPTELLSKEGLFDVAISTEVIEHLYSPHLLPRFAARLLPAGGRLVITTPYHGYLKNLALSVAGRWDKHHTALWHGGHIKFWSRSTLGELLRQEGFVVEHFEGLGRAPLLWKSMLVTARRA